MKKETKIIAAVFIVLIAIVAAMYLGLIPDYANVQSAVNGGDTLPETTCNVNLGLSKAEKFQILETLFGKDLQYAIIEPYIDALHMEVYGCNVMNAQTLLQQFEAEYVLDGWKSVFMLPKAGNDWVAYHEVFIRGSDARSVSVGEGAAVSEIYSYETVYLVAYGPQTTYYEFYNQVK